MRVFLSYASKDRSVAERTYLALRAEGLAVFFDRADLPPGEEYDAHIRKAIEGSDLLVFLVSAEALNAGSYTLTELEIAQKTWRDPGGRVLPVLLQPMDLASLPAYLRAVTVLQPAGNVPADVADAVRRIAGARRRRLRAALGVGLGALAVAVVGARLLAPGAVGTLLGHPAAAIKGNDGMPALLIPGGAFVMGDDEWSPRREVHVDAFYMDAYEVSVAQYGRFLRAGGGRAKPESWDQATVDARGDRPVVGVSWREAEAYCHWAGKRLPTEAEWEKAARGTDGRTYPWGESEPNADLANFGKPSDQPVAKVLEPVTSHASGRSPYGVYNLAGNAAEWVADWFEESFPSDDRWNPKGPDHGKGKVLRGGGWDDAPEALRTARRYYSDPSERADDRGFRCARDLPGRDR